MKMRILLPVFTLLFSLFISNSEAQVIRCATMERDAELRAMFPEMGTLAELETWMQARMNEMENSRSAMPPVFTIPVIIHIIHNGEAVGSGRNISQAQANSQITVLNEDFRRMAGTAGFNSNAVGADSEIEFCLAVVDPNGTTLAEPGIRRVNRSTMGWTAPPYSQTYVDGTIKPGTSWDPTRYCNIWVCELSGGILGYAQFPSSSGLTGLNTNGGSSNTDGVVVGYRSFGRVGNVQAPYNKGRTTTHEIGHWLGLRHIWGDGGCSVDDYCTDTPTAGAANYGCPSNPVSCSSTDMKENYMDYTDDGCMNIFTICQKTRMRTVMTNSIRRASLASSNVCYQPNQVPVASFTGSPRSGCTGLVVQFTNTSTNSPTSYNWTFTGGTPSSSTATNPSVTYNTAGTYAVTLVATNANGNNTSTQNGYITVTSTGNVTIFSEDFETGSFATNGWTVENPDNQTTWAITTVAGNTPGSKAAGVNIFNYNNAIGQRDRLVSRTIDLTNRSNIILNFQHAYRRYSANERDSLIVSVSTNGGASYPNILVATAENGTYNFATNTTSTTNFVPAATADWCGLSGTSAACYQFNLSQFAGQANVKIRFETVNAYGNNIYIDNISITANCSAPQGAPPVAAFTSNVTSGCPGLAVQFTDQSTNTPSSWTWSFPGGNPSSSTAQNPSVTYTALGTYNVTLTATNSFGNNSVTQTGYINVTNTGTTTVFSENFESNSFATNGWTVQNPDNSTTWEIVTVAGNTPGNKAARVNLFNYNASGQKDRLITRVLDFSNFSNLDLDIQHAHRRYSQNERDSLVIAVSTDGGATYPFTLLAIGENGTGTFATNSILNSAFTPTTANDWCFSGTVGASCFSFDLSPFDGMPNVRIKFETINNYGNNIYLDNIIITGTCAPPVIQPPIANFTAVPNRICPGDTIQFNNFSSNSPISYLWNFPGGSPATSTDANPLVSYSVPGVYSVDLTATNVGGSNTFTANNVITVAASPTVSLNALPQQICTGQSSVITATGSDYYAWTPSTGLSDTNTTSVTASPTVTTVYTVTGGNEDGCLATSSITITVGNSLPAPVVTPPGPVNTCQGTVTLTSSLSSAYSWSNGASTQSITVSTNGSYDVTVTSGGCSATSSPVSVNINQAFVAGILPIGPVSICPGDSITLTAIPSSSIYTWSTGATSESITVYAANPYVVTVTDQNGCSATSVEVVGMYSNSPQPDITQSGTMLTSSTASTYQWYIDGFPIVGENDQSYTPQVSGTFVVETTDANGCTSASDPFNYIITGITEHSSTSLKVYPNPANNQVIAEFSDISGSGGFVVSDVTGRILKTLKTGSKSGRMVIDLSDLSNGTYLIRLQTEKNTIVERVVLMK